MAKRTRGLIIVLLTTLVLSFGCAHGSTSPKEQPHQVIFPSVSQKVEVGETAVVDLWAITVNWYRLNALLILNATIENQSAHRRNPPILGLSGTHKVEAEGRPLPAEPSVTIISGPSYVITGRIGPSNPCFPCDLSPGDSLTYEVSYPVRGEIQAVEIVYSSVPGREKQALFQLTRNHTWSVVAPPAPPARTTIATGSSASRTPPSGIISGTIHLTSANLSAHYREQLGKVVKQLAESSLAIERDGDRQGRLRGLREFATIIESAKETAVIDVVRTLPEGRRLFLDFASALLGALVQWQTGGLVPSIVTGGTVELLRSIVTGVAEEVTLDGLAFVELVPPEGGSLFIGYDKQHGRLFANARMSDSAKVGLSAQVIDSCKYVAGVPCELSLYPASVSVVFPP